VQAGDAATACILAKHRLTVGQAPGSSYVVAALLEKHLGHWKDALTTLEEGQSLYPEDLSLQREVQMARQKVAELPTGDATETPSTALIDPALKQ
jgi:hypothetical protein